MKLTVIGCSGSMSGPDGPASAYLVETDTTAVLLDFGPGAMGRLLTMRDPATIDALLLSHLHTDHCADIIGMHVYRRWYPGGQMEPLPVYCPGDGLARTRGVGGDPDDEDYAGEFTFHQVQAGDETQIGDIRVEWFHAEHPVEACGLRLTGPNGETLGYTGDTDYCDGEVSMAGGVDLLLSEAAFEEGRDEVRGIHLTGRRAGELAATAGARSLVLTHLQPWTCPDKATAEASDVFDGPVAVAASGSVWEIETAK